MKEIGVTGGEIAWMKELKWELGGGKLGKIHDKNYELDLTEDKIIK